MPESTKNICIVHDTFMYEGGAERLMIMMANALDTDLAGGFFDPGSFDPRKLGFKNAIIPISGKGKNKFLRHIQLKLAFIFRTGFLRKYETIVLSGDCLDAVRNISRSAKVIYYCHTPPRYLFDQKDAYLDKVPSFLKPIYQLLITYFRYSYLKNLKRMDKILTNSQNTKERISEFTGRESEIIYPPVDHELFRPAETREDYFFSYARLSSIKRVDTIVRAFQSLPHKKLVIQAGKNDPERNNIQAMIENYPNMTLMQCKDQKELVGMIGRSIAVVYIPEAEDFGMIPVESMACGIPVIGVDEGGLRESILHGETGWLLSVDNLEDNLRVAIIDLTLEGSLAMKDSCIRRSKDFSLENFRSKLLLACNE